MKKQEEEFRDQIRAEIERETRTSRHRDRVSGERVHPIEHDVNQLINFVTDRRLRQPDALPAARRANKSVDTEALRVLIEIALKRGATTTAIRRRCSRIVTYCDVIETAVASREVLAQRD